MRSASPVAFHVCINIIAIKPSLRITRRVDVKLTISTLPALHNDNSTNPALKSVTTLSKTERTTQQQKQQQIIEEEHTCKYSYKSIGASKEKNVKKPPPTLPSPTICTHNKNHLHQNRTHRQH